MTGYNQLFELGVNLKIHASHENKVRRAIIEFMEFREMAMQLLVLSKMVKKYKLAHHVSCIGIEHLKLVWSLLDASSTC